jgi:hypothetical protein
MVFEACECIDGIRYTKCYLTYVCRYRLIYIDGMQNASEFGGLSRNTFSDIDEMPS